MHRHTRFATRVAIAIAAMTLTLSATGNTEPENLTEPMLLAVNADASDFTVAFSDCVESIGVGIVATETAQGLVPPEFQLAGTGQLLTPLVVRSAHCAGMAVDGRRSQPGSIVQIGAVIVPLDSTGDINNYTIWYYTSNALLALRLQLAGIPAQYVPTLDYDLALRTVGSPTPLHVAISRPGVPPLALDGTVVASATAAGAFEANWWRKAHRATVKMDTDVPVIYIGTADMILTTPAHSALAALMGTTMMDFPVLQQFNTFDWAEMQVRVLAR